MFDKLLFLTLKQNKLDRINCGYECRHMLLCPALENILQTVEIEDDP